MTRPDCMARTVCASRTTPGGALALGTQLAALETAKWLAGARPVQSAVTTLDTVLLESEKHTLVRRHLPSWKISDDGIELFRPDAVAIVRYRYRGNKIPTPWSSATTGPAAPAA